ncbi:hypothetical protein TUM18999_03040 [Pseudomonas tohonis]|uniref:HEPN domain-containing protein n=1 Tax=Pseudomonas tohonis TaxID=2725477 RepID=A0A6J4DX41_9PSED|nr:hypothetical protein [Pseudomonas tohonis]BCG22113.1 hypothetical protein TUM18999_03040 [Pseudomonas tohonis]
MDNRDALIDAATDALEKHRSARSALLRTDASADSATFKRTSIRQAVVAITSSWSYLEATLYHHGRRRLGRNYNDSVVFEAKLRALGITEDAILNRARQLRIVQRDLIHGKALELGVLDPGKAHIAQNEAEKAVALALEIRQLLDEPEGGSPLPR